MVKLHPSYKQFDLVHRMGYGAGESINWQACLALLDKMSVKVADRNGSMIVAFLLRLNL